MGLAWSDVNVCSQPGLPASSLCGNYGFLTIMLCSPSRFPYIIFKDYVNTHLHKTYKSMYCKEDECSHIIFEIYFPCISNLDQIYPISDYI